MDSSKTTVNYFGFGSNRDLEMMQHMIGRKDLRGEHGQLLGYEITIQKASQFRNEILPTSPIPGFSPRDIIIKNWGPDFEMFASRPNPKGVAYGTIWYITPEELELVENWELVDFGCQERAFGKAITDDGRTIEVVTQSFLKPAEVDRVIIGDNYNPYIWDKETMLKRADGVRLEYLKIKESLKKRGNTKIKK